MCSPSVLINDGKWYLYYSDNDGRIYQRTSENGLNWSEKLPQQLLLNVNENFVFKTVKNTHLEVRETNQGLMMIVMGDSLNHGKNLYLFTGFLGSANWYGSFEPLIKIAPGAWDGYSLYKTSFLVVEPSDVNSKIQPKLRIWYSAYRMNPVVFHIAYTESLLERWDFRYNLEVNPWHYQDQGFAFLGNPNVKGIAWLERNLYNGSVQADLKLTEESSKAGLVIRYRSPSTLAGLTLENNKIVLWVDHSGKHEERLAELGEPILGTKTYRLKLSADNQVYKAYLNERLVLTLVSQLNMEAGYSGLIGVRNNSAFKNIIIK